MVDQEVTTLIEKSCGHYGLVRQKNLQSSVACSQCEVVKERNSIVDIVRQIMVPSSEVPEQEPHEMDVWIRKQLGVQKDGK